MDEPTHIRQQFSMFYNFFDKFSMFYIFFLFTNNNNISYLPFKSLGIVDQNNKRKEGKGVWEGGPKQIHAHSFIIHIY